MVRMESERFDRWTKLLAVRMSRRAALASLGAVAIASLPAPQRVLGQGDDDDQDGDEGQANDNPIEEDPDTDRVGWGGVCQPIVSCKKYKCIDSVNNVDGTGYCFYNTIGDIPGGPYEQEWTWNIPPCQPRNHTVRELEALCAQAYPGNEDHACGNECEACAAFALVGCS
jgi:hypothetical protein